MTSMRTPEEVVGRQAVESLVNEGYAISPADLDVTIALVDALTWITTDKKMRHPKSIRDKAIIEVCERALQRAACATFKRPEDYLVTQEQLEKAINEPYCSVCDAHHDRTAGCFCA